MCVLQCVYVCVCVCASLCREYACVYELVEPLPLTGSPWIPDWPWSPGSPDAPTAPVGPDCPVRPGSPLSPWVWKGRRSCRHGNKEKSFKTSATACIICYVLTHVGLVVGSQLTLGANVPIQVR